MARRRKLSDTRGSDDINISPLIDMVFILLIFFIVTTVFVDEIGFEGRSNNNLNPSTSELETEPIVFLITDTGRIFHNEREVGLGGIDGVLSRNLQDKETPVTIRVEEGAPVRLATRIYDQARVAGAEAISLAAAE